MPRNYPAARPTRNPPHVSLRNLRRVSGLTLEQVCESVTEIAQLDKPMTRGSLSAIETGLRGPSQQVLDALAVTFGLDAGDLVVDYAPRAMPTAVPAAVGQ